ncbi:hypothetical protein Pmani_006725 [Petrolisthes manimaculis]|uniref:Uncharacterized protein n=1 Tax=Petrolisthes manimaculis TaxID=1843537 RepID=A0AAE1Q9T6_9EUCA|nr:hypothetical protein Pmani_033545 [Petrolisthes manimaculis]KAK4322546.1 hypothetical protein Pmani_006725 [Petrolisthes manimaculis]
MTQGDFFSFDTHTHTKFITKCKAPGSTIKDTHKMLLWLSFCEDYLLKSDYETDNKNVHKVRLQKGQAAWTSKLFDLSSFPLPKHYTTAVS